MSTTESQKRFRLASAWVVIICFATAGCSHTRIMTNDPAAKIYVNGAFVGTGHGKLKQMGLPKTATIEVKSNGRVHRRSVERNFTILTLVVGFFTVYTGWIWAWEYPDSVWVNLPENKPPKNWKNNPNTPAKSPWDEPPKSKW